MADSAQPVRQPSLLIHFILLKVIYSVNLPKSQLWYTDALY